MLAASAQCAPDLIRPILLAGEAFRLLVLISTIGMLGSCMAWQATWQEQWQSTESNPPIASKGSMREVMGCVFNWAVTTGGPAHKWAFNPENSTGVQCIFNKWLAYFPIGQTASHKALRQHGAYLPELGPAMRFCDVSPFLYPSLPESMGSQEKARRSPNFIVHDNGVSVTDVGLMRSTKPGAQQMFLLLFAVQLEVFDLYQERECMRKRAEQLLIPKSGQRFIEADLKQLTVSHLDQLLNQTSEASSPPMDEQLQGSTAKLGMPLLQLKQLLETCGRSERARLEVVRGAKEAAMGQAREQGRQRVLECAARVARLDRQRHQGTSTCSVFGSKIAALVELLTREIPMTHEDGSPVKVVVFTMFVDAIPLIKRALHDAGVATVTFESEGKQWAQSMFRTKIDKRVMLLHASKNAAGLTLTCASHVIFLDVLHDKALEAQAAARISRIGQERETQVWHLLAKGSIDEKLRIIADDRMLKLNDSQGPGGIGPMLRTLAEESRARSDSVTAAMVQNAAQITAEIMDIDEPGQDFGEQPVGALGEEPQLEDEEANEEEEASKAVEREELRPPFIGRQESTVREESDVILKSAEIQLGKTEAKLSELMKELSEAKTEQSWAEKEAHEKHRIDTEAKNLMAQSRALVGRLEVVAAAKWAAMQTATIARLGVVKAATEAEEAEKQLQQAKQAEDRAASSVETAAAELSLATGHLVEAATATETLQQRADVGETKRLKLEGAVAAITAANEALKTILAEDYEF